MHRTLVLGNVSTLLSIVFLVRRLKCKIDVQIALWRDLHVVDGRILLFHLVRLLLTRAPVLSCIRFWHRSLLVDHLSRDGYNVVLDELLANIRDV